MCGKHIAVFLLSLLLAGCHANPADDQRITVAAAANLSDAFEAIGQEFTSETGIDITWSYGATAQLSNQILSGAPFDVFAAADMAHVDALVSRGALLADSRAVYARGQLAIWAPNSSLIRSLDDLMKPEIRVIALANPRVAPYGEASVEALKSAGLWAQLEPKIVYANSIRMAKQFAETGNADVALTAYSLIQRAGGHVLRIDPALHSPLDQAMAVLAGSARQHAARRFIAFVTGVKGKAILKQFGYEIP